MDSSKYPLIAMLNILTDPRRIQRIAIRCRCGHRWTELVPGEIHDSAVTLQFYCAKCSTEYHLCNHKLHRVGEADNVGFDKTTINSKHYDA